MLVLVMTRNKINTAALTRTMQMAIISWKFGVDDEGSTVRIVLDGRWLPNGIGDGICLRRFPTQLLVR